MPTAIEILSQILDKDGVKHTKIDNEKIKIDYRLCDIHISNGCKL